MAELISHTAYRTSCDLAVEKGVFPLFDREAYLAGETVSALPEDIRERIAAGRTRNAPLTSIAPTPTSSLGAADRPELPIRRHRLRRYRADICPELYAQSAVARRFHIRRRSVRLCAA